MDYICGACGKRSAQAGSCGACPDEPLLDLRQEDVRQLLSDIDDRKRRSRAQMLLWVSIAAGILLVGALSFVPAWREARRRFFALPLFLDEIALMGVLAAGLRALLVRLLPTRRLLP